MRVIEDHKCVVIVSSRYINKHPRMLKMNTHTYFLLSGPWVNVTWLQVGLNLFLVPPVPGMRLKEQLLPVAVANDRCNR